MAGYVGELGLYPAISAFNVDTSCRTTFLTITPPRYIPRAAGCEDGSRLKALTAKALSALRELPPDVRLNLLFIGMRGAGKSALANAVVRIPLTLLLYFSHSETR